jgi:hypothetical protein
MKQVALGLTVALTLVGIMQLHCPITYLHFMLMMIISMLCVLVIVILILIIFLILILILIITIIIMGIPTLVRDLIICRCFMVLITLRFCIDLR